MTDTLATPTATPVPVPDPPGAAATAPADSLATNAGVLAPADSALTATGDSVAAPRPAPLVEPRPQEPPPPPAWTLGIEPQPRAMSAWRDTALGAVFLVLFLILALGLKHGKSFFPNLRRDLLSMRPGRQAFDQRPPQQGFLIALFYVQLVVFLAVLSQSWVRIYAHPHAPGWSFNLTLGLCLLWCAYYLFCQGAYRAVGYAFAPGHGARAWVRSFNASQVLLGFALAPVAAVAVFIPTAAHGALIVAAVCYIVARLAFFVKGFRIFYTNFVDLLYFFLYLCALETVPLLILYRLMHSPYLEP